MLNFLFSFAAIDAEEIPKGIMPQRRQVVGTGVTTSSNPPTTTSNPPTTTSNAPDTTTSQAPDTTTTPSSIPITTSNADGTTTTQNVPTSDLTSNTNNNDNTNTAVVQTTKGTSDANSVVKVGSTTINPKTLSAKTTVREPLVTKATRHQTLTSTWTSNGHVYSSVYTTKNVYDSTTGFATATIAPGLANGGGDGSNLSTNTKKVIGGVVGGIGGAILIGGLAFVAWRLWGKRKDAEEVPQDEMHYSSDSLSQQKRLSANTLGTYSEPYSNPNGRINTASNF